MEIKDQPRYILTEEEYNQFKSNKEKQMLLYKNQIKSETKIVSFILGLFIGIFCTFIFIGFLRFIN